MFDFIFDLWLAVRIATPHIVIGGFALWAIRSFWKAWNCPHVDDRRAGLIGGVVCTAITIAGIIWWWLK